MVQAEPDASEDDSILSRQGGLCVLVAKQFHFFA
jgi:hypothetical protein